MSSVASNAACPIFDIRLQRQSVLQVIDQELQLRVDDVQSVLQVVNMNLPDSEVFLPIRWTQIEMVSIGVRNNASCFDLLFASSDHGHFDFLQVSVPINPAAAGLVQTIHEHVEVAQIPQALVLLPLRKLHSKFSFRQVYWWYQVTSNTLEIMFALTFFLTLQRRFNSSAEGILSSLGKLQNDFLTILNGELLLPDWPVLEVLYKTLQAYFGSFFFLPVALPLQVLMVLLNFHADLLILTMLLPHVFLLWHSVTGLVYAVRKTFCIILKIGSMSKAVSKAKHGKDSKKLS